MAYCSLSDIQAVIPISTLIQLTDDMGSGQLNTAKITDAINYVDEVINGYLRGRYSLPLNTIPGMIKNLAIDFTVYRLYSRRMELNIPESITEKYKQIIKQLESIQKGLIVLEIDEKSVSTGGDIKINKSASDRVFTKEALRNF